MKTSSKVSRWWKRWLEMESHPNITAEDYQFMQELDAEDLPVLVQILDEEIRPYQRDLLMELANLQDGQEALARFVKRFPSAAGLKQGIPLLRAELRNFWREPKMTAVAVQAVAWGPWGKTLPLKTEIKKAAKFLTMLFETPPPNSRSTGWTQIYPFGITRPEDVNFRGQLAWGIAQNYSRFHICKNPDCATPFYLWRRFDQQYCSSDGCVRYANRLAANRYWDAKGKQRRSLRKTG